MAASLGRGSCRQLRFLGGTSLAAFQKASALKEPYATQRRHKSDPTMQMKHGRSGRSSFTGNVATVFGASGFVGKYVVNRLAKEGNQVIIPYRGDFYDVQKLKLAGDLGQVLFVPYEPRDLDSIKKCVKYSNWAINLIGKEWHTKNYTCDQVNVDVCRLIARGCREAGVEKFIHFSALNASPNPPKIFLKNGSPFLISKYHGECAVKEEFPDAIVFRPSDIMGHEDRFLRYWASPLRRNFWGYLPLYKKGAVGVKAPVHVSDIATAVMHAFKNKHIKAETFQCPGPEFYQLAELVDYFLDCMHFNEVVRIGFMDPRSWVVMGLASYQQRFFWVRPQFTWEKWDRDYIPDALDDDYPTIEATLPAGHRLMTVPETAPYELKMFRRSIYYSYLQDLPPPEPPQPLMVLS